MEKIKFNPTKEQIESLGVFQASAGPKKWKMQLQLAWGQAGSRHVDADTWAPLQRLRNATGGMKWALAQKFEPRSQ